MMTLCGGQYGGDLSSTPLELDTSASLRQAVTSDHYESMFLEAGTRDITNNASLTPGPPQLYLGGGATNELSSMSHQQQQGVNEWPEFLLTEYYLLLETIANSLDLEQAKNLYFISVEAVKAGICNRNDFSGMVLFDYFHKIKLITPNNLTYLTSKLQSIDRTDLCNLIDQYNSRMLCTPQPLPSVDPPVDDRPPPYNPAFVSAPIHGQPHPHPVHHVSSANTIQPMAPILSERNVYSLPFQVQDDDVSQTECNHRMHNISYHTQLINRSGSAVESHIGAVTYQTDEQLRIRQLEELVASLQSRLQDREDLVIRQGDTIVRHENTIAHHEATIDHQKCVIEYKNETIEGLIRFPDCPEERYEMNKFPHGIAVIINNFEFYPLDPTFEPPLSDRLGSCADEEHLSSTWEYLGYDVCILRNLTAVDLTQRLKQISQQDHENYDSFVCCILSHGYPSGIYGVDWEPVEIDDIANLFIPVKCPTLAGKPKMFFVQACRGEKEDPGFVLEKDGKVKKNDREETFCCSLPEYCDYLFGYATPSGSVAWRNERYGTWYVSRLCEVLTNYYLDRDLLSMLTIVNHKVSEAFTNKGHKQCPAPVNQLRKQVWFISRATE